MSYICYKCGKGKLNGNLVSHSNVHTKRKFRPNLHTFWIKDGGKRVHAKFCTKCLRRVKASLSEVSKVSRVPSEAKVPQVSQVS